MIFKRVFVRSIFIAHQMLYPALLVLTFMSSGVKAQQPFVFENWLVEDGLPNNSISDVVQTSDGYIWVAANGGLAKFDGVKFTLYDLARTPELKSNRIISLYEDPKQRLWIGTDDGGLCFYHNGRFYRYKLADPKFESITASRIRYIPGYGLAICTANHGFLLISDQDSVTHFDKENGLYSNSPHQAALYHDTLWVFDSKGSSILIDNKLQPSPWQKQKPYNHFYHDAEIDLVNDQLIATIKQEDTDTDQLSVFKNGRASILRFGPNGNINSPGVKIRKDRSGNLYLLTAKGIIKLDFEERYLGNDFMGATDSPMKEVFAFTEDNEGNFWVGTNTSGLYRLKPNPFSNLDFSDESLGNSVQSLVKDRKDVLWWASRKGILTKYEAGQIKIEAPPHVINLWSVCAKDDTLFFGGYGFGLQYLVGKTHKQIPLPKAGNQWIKALYFLNDTLYIGTSLDLFIRVNGKILLHPDNEKIKGAHINRFYKDSSGRLWILTNQDIYYTSHNETITPLSVPDKTGVTHVRSCLQLMDSLHVFGTYGNGLIIYDGKSTRVLNSANGLFDNTISDILKIGNHLWLTGNKGLTKMTYDDLISFIEQKSSFVQATLYDRTDGLTVSEFNGGTQNTSEMIGPGQYAFATINGLTIVDFGKIPFNTTPPKISIEGLMTNGKVVDIHQEINLPYEQNNIEITYTALSFTSPKNNQFKYQMTGYDKDWRDAGTERKAVYTHLPPGDYTFMVIARNNDGVWNTEAKTIKIHIIPPFYLSAWFKVLLFLTIVGAIFGLIALIIRSIREKERIGMTIEREKQQSRLQAILETEEAERKRIAEDLHDGIGPLISTVKLNLSMAEQQLPGSELILSSQNQIDSIANELRTITYNLVPTSLSAFGFATAVQEFIEKLKPESRIQFYFETLGTPLLEKPAEVILFRVVQELINNSIKHSSCTEITIQLIQDNKTFRIMMEDNGKGFDLETGVSKIQSRGLKNIADRCKVLEAHLNFDSQIGRGTSVTIEIQTR